MADVNITIPFPVLIAGQYFRVRYRIVGAPSWTNYANQTNAPFTISGLTAGTEYEVEITFYNGTKLCQPVISRFTPEDADFACWDFAAAMDVDSGYYFVHITWTPVSPFMNPPCGWIIEVSQAGFSTTLPYSGNLPLLNYLDVAVPKNITTTVRVKANMCSGVTKTCFEDDVAPISTPCSPIVITNPYCFKLIGYSLAIDFNQSSPATKYTTLTYKQVGFFGGGAGVADQGTNVYGVLPSGATASITQKVFPNNAVEPHVVQYEGTITDDCGQSHYFKTAAIPF